MFNVNRVTLLGNVILPLHHKENVVRFHLATYRKDKDGDEECETHIVLASGHLGEFVSSRLTPNAPVYLEGRLHTEDGVTVIMADRLVLLTKPKQLATAE